MNSEQEGEVISSNNEGFNNNSILDIRLNTTQFVNDIEHYLAGTFEQLVFDSEGKPIYKTKQVSDPKANKKGVHSIMLYVKSTFNPQIVQGNIENFESLENMMAYFREDFSKYLMNNLYNFEISEDEYEGIIDFINFSMRNFLSRLVGNEERKSFSNTMVTRENTSSTERERKGGFRIPGFK